jgi:hypothetical protein
MKLLKIDGNKIYMKWQESKEKLKGTLNSGDRK